MRKIFFILISFFLIFNLLAINTANSQTPPPANYVPNQLIVKYKPNQSPQELQTQVSQRSNLGKTPLLGPLMLFFTNIRFNLTGQDSPEKKLTQLEAAAKEVGVVESQKLFLDSQDATLKNYYLLKTNGQMEVLKAIEVYRKLSIVESAEPNYMFSTMGI
ncbi:hypothetical protein FJY90_07565 [Candidatus Gottesmanbacteria bacterium]|nr:hypothetical protein [Candidatus Gottesmanbacteria bacterium]